VSSSGIDATSAHTEWADATWLIGLCGYRNHPCSKEDGSQLDGGLLTKRAPLQKIGPASQWLIEVVEPVEAVVCSVSIRELNFVRVDQKIGQSRSDRL